MAYRFHVTLTEDQKDIISVENKEELPTKAFQCFKSSHDPTRYALQVFDTDFEDWVNVEPAQLPDKGKVRFVEKVEKAERLLAEQPVTTVACNSQEPVTSPCSSPRTSSEASSIRSVKFVC